jgi:hypothetical protein
VPTLARLHFAQFPVAGSHSAIDFPLRRDLTWYSCRVAEHAAQARWHGRAPRAVCRAHGGESSVRRPCMLHAPHGMMTCAVQRTAHSACRAKRTCTCHDAVRISICRAAHRQLSCQLALLGLAERAQHRTCHAARTWKTTYTCPYLVRNAGVRLRVALCRRSIQTSRRRLRSLKLLFAAQLMRRCETV